MRAMKVKSSGTLYGMSRLTAGRMVIPSDAAHTSVYPSGRDFATKSMPICDPGAGLVLDEDRLPEARGSG